MSHTFRIEHFEGPLDLLLQLVEQEKLDISMVSLATVADQFLEYIQGHPDIAPEELADFLVVAAKLVYLKSRLLLPSLLDEELEQGPDLETQLREYRRFVEVSKEVDMMWKAGNRSFLRLDLGRRLMEGFLPPTNLPLDLMPELMWRVIRRVEPILRLPEASIQRAVSIQEKIHDLFHRVKKHLKTSFHEFISGARNKTEAIVSFLALLELVKQRFVRVGQEDLFNDITIEYHGEADTAAPVSESFV